jgi:hypothetical protein
MPGDTVINKKYERTNSEATRREWKCLFLNAPGISEQDLLTLMRPQLRGEANTFVYLSDIVNYLQSNGIDVDEDMYALSEMIQFIWRGAIRQGKPMKVLILSERMRNLLIKWLEV